MKRFKKSQLNAISRSYTQKAQKEAIAYLESIGIDFEQYKAQTGWKGSPVRLVTSLKAKKAAQ